MPPNLWRCGGGGDGPQRLVWVDSLGADCANAALASGMEQGQDVEPVSAL